MEAEDRVALLRMSPAELSDVARVCNKYPNVDVSYEVEDADALTAGDAVVVHVSLEREAEGAPTVSAHYFPKAKDEGWWLVIGDTATGTLVSIKRVALQQKAKVKLDFAAPEAGVYTYMLYFMCDAYMGCDQEYEINLNVAEAEDDEEEEEDEDGEG